LIQCKKSIPTLGDVTVKTDHAFADPKLVVENRHVVPVARLNAVKWWWRRSVGLVSAPPTLSVLVRW